MATAAARKAKLIALTLKVDQDGMKRSKSLVPGA
jgi:hypothetical protein